MYYELVVFLTGKRKGSGVNLFFKEKEGIYLGYTPYALDDPVEEVIVKFFVTGMKGWQELPGMRKIVEDAIQGLTQEEAVSELYEAFEYAVKDLTYEDTKDYSFVLSRIQKALTNDEFISL